MEEFHRLGCSANDCRRDIDCSGKLVLVQDARTVREGGEAYHRFSTKVQLNGAEYYVV